MPLTNVGLSNNNLKSTVERSFEARSFPNYLDLPSYLWLPTIHMINPPRTATNGILFLFPTELPLDTTAHIQPHILP